ncbi:hypothetical protein EYC80_004804 [Monilinia laxa]|uniref:Uncharacterized protein n=1 Tax=Monilinia laxa TaxID=61186 RepID=A0A5N6KI58_MONLA|nr:hypothetical protein EYC80_004804 [Monilinia laxa]
MRAGETRDAFSPFTSPLDEFSGRAGIRGCGYPPGLIITFDTCSLFYLWMFGDAARVEGFLHRCCSFLILGLGLERKGAIGLVWWETSFFCRGLRVGWCR